MALLAAAGAAAQGYPAKPVKVIVPYPPGGATDIVARVVAQKLSEQTGQQFLVDNRGGGGGNIGAEAAARSATDGYTLLVATTAHAINRTLFKNLAYDLKKDFVAISPLTTGPPLIVANPALPAKNVKLKALAVTRAARSSAAPDIPTVAESGLPGYEAIAWNGMLAPAGTPKDVVARLSAEMKKALELTEIKERFAAQGFAAAWSSPEQYAAFIDNEVEKRARVVKVSGATGD
jgi:tripartite-type tricarboxylate transporter receptor subunit TctC